MYNNFLDNYFFTVFIRYRAHLQCAKLLCELHIVCIILFCPPANLNKPDRKMKTHTSVSAKLSVVLYRHGILSNRVSVAFGRFVLDCGSICRFI